MLHPYKFLEHSINRIILRQLSHILRSNLQRYIFASIRKRLVISGISSFNSRLYSGIGCRKHGCLNIHLSFDPCTYSNQMINIMLLRHHPRLQYVVRHCLTQKLSLVKASRSTIHDQKVRSARGFEIKKSIGNKPPYRNEIGTIKP